MLMISPDNVDSLEDTVRVFSASRMSRGDVSIRHETHLYFDEYLADTYSRGMESLVLPMRGRQPSLDS
jgi:hypothetical protein